MSRSASSDVLSNVGPCTAAVIQSVLSIWPEHKKFLKASFAARSPELLDTTEIIAHLLNKIVKARSKDIRAFAEDYRFLCEQIVYPEELHFRRTGQYRLKSFDEADTEVYS